MTVERRDVAVHERSRLRRGEGPLLHRQVGNHAAQERAVGDAEVGVLVYQGKDFPGRGWALCTRGGAADRGGHRDGREADEYREDPGDSYRMHPRSRLTLYGEPVRPTIELVSGAFDHPAFSEWHGHGSKAKGVVAATCCVAKLPEPERHSGHTGIVEARDAASRAEHFVM